MTRKQKLEIERSEKVSRLNELLGLEDDALTDEHRSEMDTLTTRMPGLETELRAAITAEAAEEAEARGLFGNNGDGEPAEIRQLLDRTPLTDVPGAGRFGHRYRGTRGRAERRVEGADRRQWWRRGRSVGGPGGSRFHDHGERTTVQRTCSGRSCSGFSALACMDTLGVRDGYRSGWPLPSGRLSRGGVDAGASQGRHRSGSGRRRRRSPTTTLKPKRLSGPLRIHVTKSPLPSRTWSKRCGVIWRDAVKSKHERIQIINGVAPTNQQSAERRGLPDEADRARTCRALKQRYNDYGRLHSLMVDGIHAETEMQVSSA